MREVIIDGVRYVPETLAPPLAPIAPMPLSDFSRLIPEPGETWRHYKGSLCHVLQVAARKSGDAPAAESTVVVYRCDKSATVWWRTLAEWMGVVPIPSSAIAHTVPMREIPTGLWKWRFVPAPPPSGQVCVFCQDPATQWQGLDPWCGPACDGVPF